jgi:putative DNA primase/helicase
VSLDLNDTGPQFNEYDLADLSQRLAERAAEWVPAYFPRGIISKDRRELRLANISGDGPRKEGSCVVGLRGEHAGDNWDFQTEKGGGPLDTLSHATGLFGRQLFAKAAEIVGGGRPKERPPASKPNGHAKSVAAEHILLATSIWDSTQDPRGTLTETNLAFRGVPLPPTEDLRHCEFCTDYAAKIARPAMIARVRRADTGEPTGGIHRTYLLEDGRPAKEAMGGKHKMALGPTQLEGGVVQLSPMTADDRRWPAWRGRRFGNCVGDDRDQPPCHGRVVPDLGDAR